MTGHMLLKALLLAAILSGTSTASAQSCVKPGCWPGRFYKFDVVAKTNDVTAAGVFSGFGDQPSVNDKGTVAFVGQLSAGYEGVFTWKTSGPPTWLSSNLSSSGRTFGRAVQINNDDQVISRDQIPGSPPPSRILRWDISNPGVTNIYDLGGSTRYFASVFAQPSINTFGQVVYSAIDPLNVKSASRTLTRYGPPEKYPSLAPK